MFFSKESGLFSGLNRLITLPSLEIRNLVKFHLIFFPNKPPVLSFRNLKMGEAYSPLTSVFFINWNVTPKLRSQKKAISWSLPGSWCPNWSQGKPIMTSPEALCFLCNSSKPLYWGVNPHLLAVFTIKRTSPSKRAKSISGYSGFSYDETFEKSKYKIEIEQLDFHSLLKWMS